MQVPGVPPEGEVMPTKIKKGSTVLVVEGPHQGERGIVSQIQHVFDVNSRVMRWTVWIDGRIKTRLKWVREI
jgi:ribosomal protein L24